MSVATKKMLDTTLSDQFQIVLVLTLVIKLYSHVSIGNVCASKLSFMAGCVLIRVTCASRIFFRKFDLTLCLNKHGTLYLVYKHLSR